VEESGQPRKIVLTPDERKRRQELALRALDEVKKERSGEHKS
jgi:hypothetical protein